MKQDGTPKIPLPESVDISLNQLIDKEDPTSIFIDFKKIGEG